MNNKREEFISGIDARPYVNKQRNNYVQPRNSMNQQRSNNVKKRRNIKNNPTTLLGRFVRHLQRNINRYKALTLAAIATATTLVGARHLENVKIDTVHNAYSYTDSLDKRAVDSEEYDNYISKMGALDLIFSDVKQGKFHDIVRKLDLEDKVLDSKQITNLALELFKMGFGEKNNVDPTQVTISYHAPDIDKISEDFGYRIGKYNCTKLSYVTPEGDKKDLIKDYFVEGYFNIGGFEPTGYKEEYSTSLQEAEYKVILEILESQTYEDSLSKALDALKASRDYVEKVRSEQSKEPQEELEETKKQPYNEVAEK